MKINIAVIGAGISGLALSKMLEDIATVKIFEKSSRVGGRMISELSGKYSFDHGAQCFTVRTKQFKDFLKPYRKLGIIQEWKGKVINFLDDTSSSLREWKEKHLVASPNMSSLCEKLSEGKTIELNTEIDILPKKESGKWKIYSTNNSLLGEFDLLISTAPPQPTLRIFSNLDANFEFISQNSMQPCIALMLGFKGQKDFGWIAAKVHNNPIKWISVNSTKPLRENGDTTIVVHAKSNWSRYNFDKSSEEIANILSGHLYKISGIDVQFAEYINTYKWADAIIGRTQKKGPYFNPDLGLAATSDWCYTSRIEEVWISAKNLASQINQYYK
ncbi:MAG: FAD-dependent oxidoreductase [Rickettsiaceae bacterium]|nr:FAD-dependent oxidoreductase [Rickettsiaceae bacterium]